MGIGHFTAWPTALQRPPPSDCDKAHTPSNGLVDPGPGSWMLPPTLPPLPWAHQPFACSPSWPGTVQFTAMSLVPRAVPGT